MGKVKPAFNSLGVEYIYEKMLVDSFEKEEVRLREAPTLVINGSDPKGTKAPRIWA